MASGLLTLVMRTVPGSSYALKHDPELQFRLQQLDFHFVHLCINRFAYPVSNSNIHFAVVNHSHTGPAIMEDGRFQGGAEPELKPPGNGIDLALAESAEPAKQNMSSTPIVGTCKKCGKV